MPSHRTEEKRAAPGTADEASGASAVERGTAPSVQLTTALSEAEDDFETQQLAPPVGAADGVLGAKASVVPAFRETDGEPPSVSEASECGTMTETEVPGEGVSAEGTESAHLSTGQRALTPSHRIAE
ncbi:unnamed protein product [Phytophthora fragariaefolia]|uniref:Unnamed protein product n=1 Tax=Phytophthora fragariaefolia TaxID=1490495 RepID=A0A9W6X8F1_9STRA|nr:unnamed protein product [Phytophthora fragariaefolia]